MKFYTHPRVELVGRPIMEIEGIQKFLKEHDLTWPELEAKLSSGMDLGDRDAEWIVEEGGRGCYMSFGGRGRDHDDHIKHIIEVAHGSVLEHAMFNFHLWGISRSLTHELVRHRAGWAYSQLSQRYVGEKFIAFCIPPAIQDIEGSNPDAYQKWIYHMQASQELYCELTNVLMERYSDIESKTERRKKARQAARSVLPNATETKILCSANIRALRHFFEMRANPAADLEIRMLAVEMFKIMNNQFPLFMHGMELVQLEDGTEGVNSAYPKV